MRRGTAVLPLVILLFAAPAHAGFNAYYEGTQLDQGKSVPAKAQFSVEPGRVAMLMKGSKSFRMLFLEKQQVLRLVSDDDKSYVDLDKKAMEEMHTDVNAEMEKVKAQMDKLPADQRAMAEQMMSQTMKMANVPPQDVYVKTEEHKAILGHECTRVDVMQGSVKRAEYWGSTDDTFKTSPEERATILAMQSYLRNYTLQMTGADGGNARAFRWDTSTDGFPLVTRCLEGDKATLDLHLTACDKKEVAADLFSVPGGYKKQDLMGDMRQGGRGRKGR